VWVVIPEQMSAARGVDLAGAMNINGQVLEHIMLRKLTQEPEGKVTIHFLKVEWDQFGIDDRRTEAY